MYILICGADYDFKIVETTTDRNALESIWLRNVDELRSVGKWIDGSTGKEVEPPEFGWGARRKRFTACDSSLEVDVLTSHIRIMEYNFDYSCDNTVLIPKDTFANIVKWAQMITELDEKPIV